MGFWKASQSICVQDAEKAPLCKISADVKHLLILTAELKDKNATGMLD